MKRNNWFYIAMGSLIISILSLFTSVVTYRDPGGNVFRYNILDLFYGDGFVDDVLAYYRGDVLWKIDTGTVRFLAFLAIAALVISVVGICTIRAQHPRKWQLIMTIFGLIGTSIPAMLVFFAVSQSRNGFDGNMGCGFAPVIMPVATIVSIVAVLYRQNNVNRELEAAKEKKLIWEAEDLEKAETPFRKEEKGYWKSQGRLSKD